MYDDSLAEDKVIRYFDDKKLFSTLYTYVIVLTCRILLLNIVIAFLTNAYTRYRQNTTGIYLTKIIGSRSSQASDPHYGCYLSNLTPADFVLLPFIPYAMFKKPSKELNDML